MTEVRRSYPKAKVIGHAIDDKGTVELTGNGLSLLFEYLIEIQGRETFEIMMKELGWIKIQSSPTTARKEE